MGKVFLSRLVVFMKRLRAPFNSYSSEMDRQGMRLSSLMSVACCPEGGKGEGSLNYEGSESNVQCSNDKKNEWCNFVIREREDTQDQ